ncbi:hypothetical protein [Klenkia terrae]|uniref:Uncharacterized protein n=1 Tax=Klenkia terrae TaxID=1052259 RepID=A0ABU8E7F0_9ACTN|nr:hypothetical protein [Klenkia terrae]SSC23549.1 Hypothetical protein KLENKIAIHU_2148 [Klenkia terrae]
MTDDDLDRRLRAADPLPDLPALRPDRLDQLLEDTVTSTAPQTHRRPRALLLAGAAAAVVAVGGGALWLTTGDGDPTVLTAQPVGGPAASCAAITPETLAGSDVAFAARVTGVEGGTVTLETTERFAGDVADTVEVVQGDAGDVVDGAPLELQPGTTYLLTADGGTIGSCSGSGADSPELRALFEAAFG